jgi:coproporphyrinogen III oxidase-like Fe-S oxidoreductase
MLSRRFTLAAAHPSMLSPKELSSILNLIFQYLQLLPQIWNLLLKSILKMLDAQYFSALKDLGVNRISLGIQSFSRCKATLAFS